MSGIKEFINNHFNFTVYGVTIFSIVVAFLVPILVIFCEPYSKIGYENGLLENIQMVFLFAACWAAYKNKTDKKFFNFVIMVLGILILREINCGRTIFFAIPGTENAFYRWSEIKYGYLAHPIFGVYIAFTAIYFLKNKLFINLWNYLRKTSLPFWNIAFMFAGMFLGLYAEKAANNNILEEISELLFYTSLFGIIWLYSLNKIGTKD